MRKGTAWALCALALKDDDGTGIFGSAPPLFRISESATVSPRYVSVQFYTMSSAQLDLCRCDDIA